MSYLYHWRKENYQSDPGMREDPPFPYGITFNSRNKLFGQLEEGEILYVFSRRTDGVYVLVAKASVCDVYEEEDEYCAGIKRESLTFFVPALGEDLEPVIRDMPLSLENPSLGRNFQGLAHVKKVPDVSIGAIEEFSKRQKVL